jgi:hypothetical protein
MAESVGRIVKGIEQQKGAGWYAETIMEGLAPLAGLPVLGLYKRPKRAIEEKNPGALIGWYEESGNTRRTSTRRAGRSRSVKRRR